MKSTIKDNKQDIERRDTQLFRELFHLQIRLELKIDEGHPCMEELEEITDSIDRLFDRMIHLEMNE